MRPFESTTNRPWRTLARRSACLVALTFAAASLVPTGATAQTEERGLVYVTVVNDRGTPDTDDDRSLDGASVAIHRDDGDGAYDADVDELVFGPATADDEEGLETELPTGAYWVVEVGVPDGFAGPAPLLVEVDALGGQDCYWGIEPEPFCEEGDGFSVVYLKNTPTGDDPHDLRGRIEIWKLDSIEQEPLAGARFEVRIDDGDDQFDAASDGLAFGPAEADLTTSHLEPGNYWIVEVEAPSGFAVNPPILIPLNTDPDRDCFWVPWVDEEGCSGDGEGRTLVVILDEPTEALARPIRIRAVDDRGTLDDPSDDEPLTGVTVTVHRSLGDDDGDPRELPIAFGPGTVESDDGLLTDPLMPGWYWIETVGVPAGFEPGSIQPVLIQATADEDCTYSYDLWHCQPGDGDVTVIVGSTPGVAPRPQPTLPPTDAVAPALAPSTDANASTPLVVVLSSVLAGVGAVLLTDRRRRRGQ